MKKLLSFSLLAIILSVSGFALTPIYPHKDVCVGSTITIYDTTAGGSWSTSNTAVATIDPFTGVLTGVSGGTATITYDISGTYVTSPITVAILPSPISGLSTMCAGTTSTFTDATPGGIWNSTYYYVATVGSSSGLVSAAHAGTVGISYGMVSGCEVSTTVTVTSSPSVSITGPSTVCVGSTISLSDSAGTSGAWSSGATAIAVVGSTGIVTGTSPGTATISYSYTGTCGTIVGVKVITVTTTTSPGSISGTSTVTAGTYAYLSDAVPGGVWSSDNTSVAMTYGTGLWYGVAAGTATISYTVSGCSGPAYATQVVTVNPFDGITGDIRFTGPSYYGPVKVYLITFNPGTLDLEAYDSTIVYCSDSLASYSFSGVPTDSFRVKAAVDSFVGTTGYVPTYHNSSFYWYSANVFYHVSGTTDANKDITMLYGTVPSGPGFIGGNVGTGANKGTSGGAAGLNVYAIDGSGNVLMTTTDGSGNYSFSNLPLDTYEIFPEALNYVTTPISGLTLTTASPTISSVGFIQHTISYTITPGVLEVSHTAPAKASVVMFPNPANNRLNLVWNGTSKEKGDVTITDVTGREVYATTLDMTASSGNAQISLSGIANGDYIVTVKSASLNFSGKLTVQQ